MRRPVVRLVALGMFVSASLIIAAMLARNYQFEAGARALKAGNYTEAVSRIRRLAQFGDKPSQCLLGEMYVFGRGVKKDNALAIYWFRKAAIGAKNGEDGAAPAELAISKMYSEGLGV